ncbi:MAG: hypothetical protein ACO2ZP_01525 [Bacteriovoracaceae bacterium]
MRKVLLGTLLASNIAPASWACDFDGISGIVEDNDLWIGVDSKATSTITEDEFNKVIDKVEAIYTPIIEAKGAQLKVERNWQDGTVNAYAQRQGTTWKVAMYGGLARHQAIDKDSFALVVCHELGHHIGGVPKKNGWWGSNWASNEGQSDYWGTMKCLRKVFEGDDNRAVISQMNIDPHAKKACESAYSSEDEIAVCQRTAMAGLGLGNLFKSLRNLRAELKFNTPDPNIVQKTDDNHPAPQCRLDTYFSASICDKDAYSDVSETDANINVCTRVDGDKVGIRPLCWFKPNIDT